MANLNIPFVLLDKETCVFRPSISASHLVHHSKVSLRENEDFNLENQALATNQDEESKDIGTTGRWRSEMPKESGGLLAYLGSALAGAAGDSGQRDNVLSTKQFKAPIQFDTTKQNLLVLADEKTGTLALCSHELHGCEPGISRLLVNI